MVPDVGGAANFAHDGGHAVAGRERGGVGIRNIEKNGFIGKRVDVEFFENRCKWSGTAVVEDVVVVGRSCSCETCHDGGEGEGAKEQVSAHDHFPPNVAWMRLRRTESCICIPGSLAGWPLASSIGWPMIGRLIMGSPDPGPTTNKP